MNILSNLKYPSGAEFAFTILDDTDDTTLANGRPVYELLRELGMRTTKTVWALDSPPEERGPYFAGETLSSPAYIKWVHELVENGFEIAFHNATMSSSLRKDTIRALDLIEREFGQPARVHCNHGQNRENLYWGVDRYSSYILKRALGFLAKFHSYPAFEGSNPESLYYWSDIADERLSYIRAFTFRRLNGMHIPPGKLYRDIDKPLVPLLFNTADAPDVKSFNRLVNPVAIDNLRKQKGWAIVSTHLGKGFCLNNRLDPDFVKTMKYFKSLPGWFVPVSQMLDFIKEALGVSELSHIERCRMECSHVVDRINGKYFGSRSN